MIAIGALLGKMTLMHRVLAGGAVVALLMLGLRWYGNTQYDEGVNVGRFEAVEEINDAVNAAREEEREALRVERNSVLLGWDELDSAKLAFETEKSLFNSTFNQRLIDINTTLQEDNIRATEVSDNRLPDAIRDQLTQLRTRNAGSTAPEFTGIEGSTVPTD